MVRGMKLLAVFALEILVNRWLEYLARLQQLLASFHTYPMNFHVPCNCGHFHFGQQNGHQLWSSDFHQHLLKAYGFVRYTCLCENLLLSNYLFFNQNIDAFRHRVWELIARQ